MQAYERPVMLRRHPWSLIDARLATGQAGRAREPKLPLTGTDYPVQDPSVVAGSPMPQNPNTACLKRDR
jgi:hypothetical protein